MIVAELSAADLALVVVTGCSIVAVGATLFGLRRLLITLRNVQRSVDELTATAQPLIDQLAVAIEDANEELARVDRLVGSAESISATVDATTKLAYRALSAPVIKTVAMTSGASRAAKRLRKE